MIKPYSRYIDYLIEFNIVLLIFTFPLIHIWFSTWFNNFWDSLIVLWLLRQFFFKDKISIPIPPSGLFWFLFISTIIFSSFFSEQFSVSLKNIIYPLKGTALCIVLYDFSNQDEKRFQRIITYFIVSSALVAIDAVLQVMFGKDLLGIPLRDMRATAFFSHPFFLALWSGIGLFLAIVRFFEAPTKTQKVVYQICFLILVAAFLFSKTRAAWIAMGTILLISLFSMPSKRNFLKVIFPLGAILVILFIADDSLRTRALSVVEETDPRWSIWKQSLTMVKERFTSMDWFWGRGPGVFKVEYSQFDFIQGKEQFSHMILLELFYASGLFGIVTFILWLFRYMYKLFSLILHNNLNVRERFIGLMPILILLTCFINESFFSRYFSFTFWIFTGISFSLLNRTEGNANKKKITLASQDVGITAF